MVVCMHALIVGFYYYVLCMRNVTPPTGVLSKSTGIIKILIALIIQS